ncbi:amino acid efflux transporter [Nonomuraea thailandensis]|uniref:Amino acid efflux transporter n=1 Tax=Nonomuraea thailandensis TaxID=1188745 RepID=A0A9X2K670_9ACTN|nr:amino acid permease [Nonomuraea thailandensis]MCP2362272.1 amino acid efflux transporter [Nonomuraea thailandensis]
MGAWQGTALLVGAVLGPGMLVLPHLAAAAAGPASVLAWAGMLALSVPVALTFAALGARYPGGGGVAAVVGLAFGRHAAAVAGWWFYGAVPIGTVAGALVGGQYVEACLGLDATPAACLILAAAFAANAAGLRTSGRLQIGFVALLVTLLATAVLTAAPHADPANFTPFAPYGLAGVAGAAGVLMFAFVGWEAASHLSGEFARRDGLMRATAVTLVVIGLLYAGVSVTSVGVLGADMSAVPLTGMLELGLGPVARPVTGVVAVLLTFGAVNTYLAGAARLGAALAADGALPRWFARGGAPGQTPYRSLGLVLALSVPVLVWAVDLDMLMRATSACLAAVTSAGVAAAVRMLPAGRHRITAIVGTGMSLLGLAFCGAYLLVPAVLGAVALAAIGINPRRSYKIGL